ncbi:MAG: hypothetical protein KBD78_02425 [Oligoflexales bacterium]|nr:hypothetical protein [Oligoflexales bacterium]
MAYCFSLTSIAKTVVPDEPFNILEDGFNNNKLDPLLKMSIHDNIEKTLGAIQVTVDIEHSEKLFDSTSSSTRDCQSYNPSPVKAGSKNLTRLELSMFELLLLRVNPLVEKISFEGTYPASLPDDCVKSLLGNSIDFRVIYSRAELDKLDNKLRETSNFLLQFIIEKTITNGFVQVVDPLEKASSEKLQDIMPDLRCGRGGICTFHSNIWQVLQIVSMSEVIRVQQSHVLSPEGSGITILRIQIARLWDRYL